MTKIVRDDESAEMLQIIFDNKFYELGQWGTKVYENLCAQVMGGKCEIASFIEKNRKLTEDQFAAVKDYYNFSGK